MHRVSTERDFLYRRGDAMHRVFTGIYLSSVMFCSIPSQQILPSCILVGMASKQDQRTEPDGFIIRTSLLKGMPFLKALNPVLTKRSLSSGWIFS